ncbi:MAG TPA: hypothetical protein VFA66_04835 [Gaiellaceae bacterium]|nr:hypothetical protein [Gaiellaceae bacterium]
MAEREEALARLRAAARRLDALADQAEAEDASREDVELALADALGAHRQLFGPRPRARRGEGGGPRLLAYFQAHVGEWLSGDELRAASGFIDNWARRVRELRVQQGYEITERGDMYRLESATPNDDRAGRWQRLNAIRRTSGSGFARLQRLFEEFVGEVIDGETIAYVARIRSGPRRVRELRDEHGWPINSHVDEEGLRSGEYRLVSADPADRRDTRQRLYEEDVRERVFARDNYTCQVCGRNREKALAAGDTRFYLELHHKKAVAEELDALPPEELNKEENLITLCHADHLKETAAFQERRRIERRGR